MRPDRRDLSPAWPRTGSLLAAGPWLRGAASARSVRNAQPADHSICRRAPAPSPLARKPTGVAINCEASVIIFHDGWYYLLVTDGACAEGPTSNCNIRIGRSRKVTGPFVDNMGIEMLPDRGKRLGRPARSDALRSSISQTNGSAPADYFAGG